MLLDLVNPKQTYLHSNKLIATVRDKVSFNKPEMLIAAAGICLGWAKVYGSQTLRKKLMIFGCKDPPPKFQPSIRSISVVIIRADLLRIEG
jgi:hypothetical protein